MITRDPALSAGLRFSDLCLALWRNLKNKKNIYGNEILVAEFKKICNFIEIYTKMKPKQYKEELYSQVRKRLDSNASIEVVTQEIASYIASQLIQEREVVFFARGIESGSYWQDVKAEIEKDKQNSNKPVISQLQYNLNRDEMADDHYELGGEG